MAERASAARRASSRRDRHRDRRIRCSCNCSRGRGQIGRSESAVRRFLPLPVHRQLGIVFMAFEPGADHCSVARGGIRLGDTGGPAAAAAGRAVGYCASAMPAGGSSANLAGAGVGSATGARGRSGRRVTRFGCSLTTGLGRGGGVTGMTAVWSGGGTETSGAGAGAGSASSTGGSRSVTMAACAGNASGAGAVWASAGDWPRTTSMPPGTAVWGGRGCDVAGHVEGRIAFLKTELKITDAQMPLWNAVADAIALRQRTWPRCSVCLACNQ